MIFQKDILESDRIAIKDDQGNALTYQQAYREAKQMQELAGKRRLVSVLCTKTFETAALLLKLFILNQPVILIGGDADRDYLARIEQRFHPQYFWNGKELLACNSGNREAKIHKDLALLLSTTGTVGSPKFVRISYRNLCEEIRIGIEAFRIQAGQRGIQVLPLEHVYGLTFCLYHWYCGACMIITGLPVMGKRFAELWDREVINNLAGVPVHYQMLRKSGFWSVETRKTNLNCALTAGARLSREEQAWYVSMLGKKFKLCYGQTETTSIVLAGSFNEPGEKPGTIGQAAMHVKASADQNGELWIQSPVVCMGYASDEGDLNKGDENGGLLATGDLAERDAEGYWFLKGRVRRFVKILGNRIGLDEIEELLQDSMPGEEFACTGTDDELNVYFTASKEEAGKKKYGKILFERAGIPFSMVRYYQIEEIPRSAAGKVVYSKLGSLTKKENARN